MTIKERLQKVRTIDARIKVIEAELNALRTEQYTLNSITIDGMPKGNKVTDPTGEAAARLIDKLNNYFEKLVNEKANLWAARIETVELISEVERADLNRILYMRYVQCERWEVIACDLNYSFRHVLRLHGEALRELEQKEGNNNVG